MSSVYFNTEPELTVVIVLTPSEAYDLTETMGWRHVPQPNQLYTQLLEKQENGEFDE